MNTAVADVSRTADQVGSLLLPLAGNQLLVPITAVAEVVAGIESVEPPRSGEPWLYGWVQWREQRIPLLSFEALAGGERPPFSNGDRIAVCNAVGAAADLGFFGLRLDDYPSPVQITAESGLAFAAGHGDGSPLLMSATLADAEVSVPNLESLETLCAALRE